MAALATRVSLPPVVMPPPLVAASNVDAGDTVSRAPVWRAPGLMLAVAILGLYSFGSGALGGFTSVYLRSLLGAGALVGGLGIAAFQLVSFGGRIGGSVLIRRYGERAVVIVGGSGAAIGIACAIATTQPFVAIAGLLLVSVSVAPVMPIGYSLAARAAPEYRGRAMSLVAQAAYGAAMVSPLIIGVLADVVSLRAALLLLIVIYSVLAILARHIPSIRTLQ